MGLSLSEAEASIAAPFTSKIPNISPIVQLLKEGRASIVTCFQVFKFMALYSMIQFCSVIILYGIGSNLGDWQFLYIDMFLIIPLSLTMSRSGPHSSLDKSRPIGKLISFSVLFSVIGQMAIQAIFQIGSYMYVTRQSWFSPLEPEDDKNIQCMENTTLFLISLAQYIIVVIAFSVGKPFRQPIYKNYSLVVCLLIFGAITYLMILFHPKFIVDLMELATIPFSFRLTLVGFTVANLIFSYMLEEVYLCFYRRMASK